MNQYKPRLPTAKSILPCVTVCALALTLLACQNATIYVPSGAPVRLRETVKGVDVWVQNENGAWVEGRMDLPEGWYALSDDEPAKETWP